MKKNKEIFWIVIITMLTNLARIIVFVELAIFFNHWWVVLFVGLFLEKINYYYNIEIKEENKNE